MSGNAYISTDQPILFINGYWLDDARAIEYQVSDPKEPLYGFRDTQFSAMARGQTVVHGMLDINFRRTGYLLLVLDQLRELRELGLLDPLAIDEDENALRREQLPNDLRTLGLDPRDLTAQDIADLLAKPHTQFDVNEFVRVSDAIKETFWDAPNSKAAGLTSSDFGVKNRGSGFEFARRAGQYPAADENPEGFDITVVFRQPSPSDPEAELDDSFIETLKDVHVVTQSKMIINAVPGGGEAIIERYQFIARNVE